MPRKNRTSRISLEKSSFANSTIEVRIKNGITKYLSTADYPLNVPGYSEPFASGLIRVGEVQENLGAATSNVSIKVANTNNLWSIWAASPARPLELAEIIVRSLKRDDEFMPTITAHDYFFTGVLVKATPNEEKQGDASKGGAVTVKRTVDFAIVSDLTAAGVCLATDALTAANGFVFPEAADVSTVPASGGGIGQGDLGGGNYGGNYGGGRDDPPIRGTNGGRGGFSDYVGANLY